MQLQAWSPCVARALLLTLLCGACGQGSDPIAREICGNGVDDDRSGAIDCADPACLDHPTCNTCGDGVATGREGCDGNDLRGKACTDLGFNTGRLACLSQCVYDLRDCARVELCGNAMDDDGDGTSDCADPDCADLPGCTVCGDGKVTGTEQCDDLNHESGDCCDRCQAEPGCEIERNDTVAGATALVLDAEGGYQVRGTIRPAGDVDVFAVTVPAGSTGTVSALLMPFGPDGCSGGLVEILDAAGTVVASSAFSDGRDPPACAYVLAFGLPAGAVRLRVRAGPQLPDGVLGFELSVTLELTPCGDGVAETGQECDDGNARNGDGCSSSCLLETVTTNAPGETLQTAAGPLATPFAVVGTIDVPEDDRYDVDWFAIQVPSPANLAVRLVVLGAPDCSMVNADLRLFTLEGMEVGGAPFLGIGSACAKLETGSLHPPPAADLRPDGYQLPAGDYYVRVWTRPSPGQYRLSVSYIGQCGNGLLESAESCDDGNVDDGDGCNARCRKEAGTCGDLVAELGEECDDGNTMPGDCCDASCRREAGCEAEPNDTSAQADGPWDVPGTISTSGAPFNYYPDYHAIRVSAPGDLRVVAMYPAAPPPNDKQAPQDTPPPPNYTCFGLYQMELALFDGDRLIARDVADAQGCADLRVTVSPGTYQLRMYSDFQYQYPDHLELAYHSRCGDGRVSGSETCDDASPACVVGQCRHRAVCGDAIVTAPEPCDDGNLEPDDGCSPLCLLGAGGGCGDGHLDPGEACDDRNWWNGDGCSDTCAIEPEPPRCGDGLVNQDVEQCDDGNPAGGDGCSASCKVEPGFEREPNDDGTPSVGNSDFLAAAAQGPISTSVLLHATIAPFGDDDVYAVTNPGSAPVHVTAETFGPDGAGTCQGIDTELRLRDATAALLGFDDDSGIGGCSKLGFDLAASATRYLIVTDSGDNSIIPGYLLELGFP